MGDPSYYTIQGYKQLQLLIGHVRDNDEVGTMIRQEIELLQITAGVSKPIMHRESDSEWKHWVEPTWITAIKTFLTGINAGLHFTDEWLPACPRKGDAFIMDSVGKEVKEEIANQVNRCRIFLHCITLTDIATPDGKYLDRNTLYGRRNPAYESVLKWPKQQEIYKEGWTVWRTYLQETFCLPHTYELCTPLGDWEKGKGHLRWNLYQDIVTKYIYRRTPGTAKETWTRHRPTLDNKLVLNSSDGTSYQPPRHAFRVSFKSSSPRTWILYDSNKQPMKVQPYHERPATDDSEQVFLHRLYGQTLQESMRDYDKLRIIAEAIRNKTAAGGSDGSVREKKMTFGWVLQTNQGEEHRIEGPGIVDGDQDTNDSTRAERGGRIGILGAICYIAQKFKIQTGMVNVYIDNKTALEYGNKPREGDGPFKHLTDDYDLKCWVSRLETRLEQTHGIKIQYHHVYSHQDDPLKVLKIHRGTITLQQAKEKAANPGKIALLNIACDKAANRGWTDCQVEQSNNPILPKELRVALDIKGTFVFRNMKKQIEWASSHGDMEAYMQEKYEWGDSFQLIDWKALGMAFKTLPQSHKVSVMKGSFDWRPSNRHLHRRNPKKYPSDKCSVCKLEEETNEHIYRCPHHTSRLAQLKALNGIRTWGHKRKAHPLIIVAITRYLHTWMRGKEIDMEHRFSKSNPIHNKIWDAVQTQNSIGWDQALRGRLSIKWGEAQRLYDTALGKPERKGFMATLIAEIWTQQYNMWHTRNKLQHGDTPEDSLQIQRDIINPQVRTAYKNKHKVSLFNQRLFRLDMGRRLSMYPAENERWLEIVQTALTHRRIQEEAVITATRRMTEFYERKKQTSSGTTQGESGGGHRRRYRQTTISDIAENTTNRTRGRCTHEDGEEM